MIRSKNYGNIVLVTKIFKDVLAGNWGWYENNVIEYMPILVPKKAILGRVSDNHHIGFLGSPSNPKYVFGECSIKNGRIISIKDENGSTIPIEELNLAHFNTSRIADPENKVYSPRFSRTDLKINTNNKLELEESLNNYRAGDVVCFNTDAEELSIVSDMSSSKYIEMIRSKNYGNILVIKEIQGDIIIGNWGWHENERKSLEYMRIRIPKKDIINKISGNKYLGFLHLDTNYIFGECCIENGIIQSIKTDSGKVLLIKDFNIDFMTSRVSSPNNKVIDPVFSRTDLKINDNKIELED